MTTASVVPAGMTIVTKEEFFAADPRDIMPSSSETYSRWETRDRVLWGWTAPGWKNVGSEKTYAFYRKKEVSK